LKDFIKNEDKIEMTAGPSFTLGRSLRKWQEKAIKAWIDANHRGIVEVATAGGKTVFAIECISRWLADNPNSKVLIIVPTTALQDQWFSALTVDSLISENEICLWPEESDVSRKYHIMVVNTGRAKAQLISNASPDLLLVADECHRYASRENSGSLSVAKKASLGLTATAERDFDDGLNEVLIPNLGKIIYEYTIADAREDEVIAPFEIRNVRVKFQPSELEEYTKLSKKLAQAFSRRDEEKIKKFAMLRAQISRNATSRIPTASLIVEQHRGKRIIVFHEEIQKAELIADVLKKRGHSVAIYHSQMSSDKRRENLKQFRKGIIEVLVCCRALDEGVDVPESEIAIIAASTSSSRQRIQRMGRVIRLHDSKEKAIIYTIYITDREQEKLQIEEAKLSQIATFKWFEAGIK